MKRKTPSSEEGSQCRVNFYVAILSWTPSPSYHLFITSPSFFFQSVKQGTKEFEEDGSL